MANRWLLFTFLSAACFSLGCDDDDNDNASDDAVVTDVGGSGGSDVGGSGGSDVGGSGGSDVGGSGGSDIDNTKKAYGEACSTPEVCQLDDNADANERREYQACIARGGCDSNGDTDEYFACLNRECQTGSCLTFLSDKSFCSQPCTQNNQCKGASENSPYGTDFTCVGNGQEGNCMPGSNKRCDNTKNGKCDADNEVCKPQLIWASDTVYGGVCQPATPEGLGVGEDCNEDEGKYCANDFCFIGSCSNFCDPNASTPNCDPQTQQCYNDFPLTSSGSVTFDICVPKYCSRHADCPSDKFCDVTLDFGGDPYIVGYCNSRYENEEDNHSICLTDGSCYDLCADDTDCTTGVCQLMPIGISATEVGLMKICDGAASSHRTCKTDSDCAASGSNPEEVCNYVMRGELNNGRLMSTPTLEGVCVAKNANGGAIGETCNETKPCANESLCMRASSTGQTFCSQTCRNTSDCSDNMYCALVNYSSDYGLLGGVCYPSAGSMIDCSDDVSLCAENEYCNPNVVKDSNGNWALEYICLTGRENGAPAGQACTRQGDCLSGSCTPWSTGSDGTVKAFCEGICREDADCSDDGSSTCEQVLYLDQDAETTGDEIYVGYCIPAHVCATCSERLPCGGDLVCTSVNYSGNVNANACLPRCGTDDSCDEGFTCNSDKICIPNDPNTTCIDAKPKR